MKLYLLIQQKALLSAPKKQKNFYSGKKKRHTLKTQIIVDKKQKAIICTNFSNGKRHDFRLFKESGAHIHPEIIALRTKAIKKKTKKNPLTKEDKKKNRGLSSERVLNENVIGMVKRFKIVADRYRNRR